MFYMTQDPLSLPNFTTYPVILFTEFEVDTTFVNLPVDESVYMSPVIYVVHVAFTLISAMLLTNLLIAMMSDTQARVGQERDELWRTQVAATILMLERRLPRRLVPRLGICGLKYAPKDHWYLRVEDTNDQMMPKMKQYIEAFCKGDGKADMTTWPLSGNCTISSEDNGGHNETGVLNRWELIRHSVWGLEMKYKEL
ncbi:Transient receptor potential cation channel subfamily V member 5 [Channa argus]|uniref:Transient receptor potential cation channel subfamily V member 5 n=1 Tax=Channa argus TaxID=215402 RepID=A0A6G1QD93_CHAAH|nr:Transient receptor potential cation channel subfamily V member 5 [Channa argus]